MGAGVPSPALAARASAPGTVCTIGLARAVRVNGLVSGSSGGSGGGSTPLHWGPRIAEGLRENRWSAGLADPTSRRLAFASVHLGEKQTDVVGNPTREFVRQCLFEMLPRHSVVLHQKKYGCKFDPGPHVIGTR